MLHSGSETSAYRTGLAGVGRVDEFDLDAGSFGFVGDEGLQLRPGPTVQPGAKLSAGYDPFADVGKVFHGYGVASVSDCLLDNSLADFVVHMGHMPGFAARGFLQQLTCRLGAVALKPGTKGKVRVAVMPEFASAKELAGAHGGNGVLSQIHAGNDAGMPFDDIGEIKHQVEEELTFPQDQFCFFGRADAKDVSLKLPQLHRNDDPALGGKEGQGIR